MPEFGNINALAVSGDYDKQINDARYHQQQLQQQASQNEAKRRLFESDIEFQSGSNPFDAPLVKQENQKIVQQLGKFISENPDWDTNFEKRGVVKQMKRSLKDNPHVLRAMATNENRKALLTYAQEMKQKGLPFDEAELNNQLTKYDNYEKFGNPEGLDAAKAEGLKPYVFIKPKDFIDTNKAFEDIGNGFKDMKVNTKVKGGLGAYEEYANPETLKGIATQMYLNNKRQFDQQITSKGQDPIKFIMGGIDAHIAKKRDMGDYGLSKAMALEKYKFDLENANTAPIANTYQMAVRSKDKSMVPVKAIDAIVGDGAKTIIKSKDGKITDVTGLFKTKNTGYNFRSDNKGTRLAESVGYIPLDQAVEMGIVDSGFGPFTDDEINPNYKQFAQIVTSAGDDGKTQKAVKVTAFKIFDENNPANEGIFNSETMTSKQQPLPSNMSQQRVIAGSADDFRKAGWNDNQIKEGIQSGKIKVTR